MMQKGNSRRWTTWYRWDYMVTSMVLILEERMEQSIRYSIKKGPGNGFFQIFWVLLRGNSTAMTADFGILLVRYPGGPAGEQRDEGTGISWMGPAGGCFWPDV
jgi:hypothetical protein